MPSQSVRCRRRKAAVSPAANGTLSAATKGYIPLTRVDSYRLSQSMASFEIPLYGATGQNASGYTYRCYCGWATAGGLCRVDPAPCATADLQSATALSSATKAAFRAICDAGSYSTFDDWVTVYRVMEATWRTSWTCPDMQLSDVWGVVSDAQVDYWFANIPAGFLTYAFDWADFMHLGTAGVSLSNAEWLAQNYYTFLNPSARRYKLYNPDTDVSVALEDCIDETNADSAQNGFQAYVGSLTSVYGYFKDHLMPVMRTTHASGGEAFCERFVLELARLEALLYVDQATRAPTPNPEIAAQRSAVDLWRLRCLTQVRMVGLCSLHGVFDIVPAAYAEPSCPFAVGPGCGRQYVTRDCIVYCDGTFYDPCLCAEKVGLATCAGFAWAPGTGSCALPFDPRRLDDESIRLSTVLPPQTFPVEEILGSGLTDAQMVALASRIAQYEADYLKVYRPAAPELQYLQDELVASSKGGEGMLSGTPVGAQEFCDGVADYWPADWVHPNGYHVTTGCKRSETAYRGYDTWMSVDYDAAGNKVLVVDARRLRNETLLKNYFGAAGACSAVSYGMPMWKTNNARLQARWRDGQSYDPTQPTGPTSPAGNPNYIQTQTAGDWTQVPTRGPVGDNSRPSAGLLYHWWPFVVSESDSWPVHYVTFGF
eukprot:365513-Hanusia_phi.AAC.1